MEVSKRWRGEGSGLGEAYLCDACLNLHWLPSLPRWKLLQANSSAGVSNPASSRHRLRRPDPLTLERDIKLHIKLQTTYCTFKWITIIRLCGDLCRGNLNSQMLVHLCFFFFFRTQSERVMCLAAGFYCCIALRWKSFNNHCSNGYLLPFLTSLLCLVIYGVPQSSSFGPLLLVSIFVYF